jgi:Tannase and feruloyl esterase
MTAIRNFGILAATVLLVSCQSMAPPVSRSLGAGAKVSDPAGACAGLTALIPSSAIGLPSGAATIEAAVFTPATPLTAADRGPTPAAMITPANPDFCKVLGSIAPVDPAAPAIKFQVNLPVTWNGRSVQYGGGGFNGVLINALGLIPAGRFDQPAPLAQGYVTYGTDSGHQNQPGQPPQTFALNEEALVNFSHASYKKVRDVAVALMARAYGAGPEKLYFVGSSEGGREGLTMAQRYPKDFDGIFSRVPVINWTGLQLAGTRNGAATIGDAWLRPAQVKLVHEAVLAACDEADGLKDGLVSDAVGCKARFDVTKLRCAAGASGDACLSDLQVRAVQTLHSSYKYPFAFAHGVTEYPGWGVSGEGTPAFGPTGGWSAWWLGSTSPTLPPQPSNGIAWFYGSGALQYFYARDPKFDVRNFNPEQFAARIREVSALMDSTNPDLSAFHARGGKLIMLENMADYAQSPYAGIRYYESVVAKLGAASTAQFLRLYTAPGVDHVGSGGPANVDMLTALTQWVEKGQAPSGLQLVSQNLKPPFAVTNARPMCEWPMWARYKGGDANAAASFECVKTP